MIKFISTSYMPIDKDIVREMWVSGDLKDRLGIKHRRSDKNKASKPEVTPMFRDLDSRSVSELSSVHDEYEPTMTRSPRSVGFMSPPTKESLLDTPPSRAGGDDIEMQTHAGFVLTKPSFEIGEDDVTPVATRSRNPLTSPTGPPDPISPHGSYYSASDIPAPSPLPEPIYRYTTGELTTNPPTRATSIYTVRDDAESSQLKSPPHIPHTLPTAHENYGSAHHSSGSTYSAATSPGTYGMRVRSPPHDESEHHLATPHSDPLRSASEMSYATVVDDQEEWLPDGGHDRHGHSSHRHIASHVSDDQATVIQDDHLYGAYNHDRPVSGTSWDGGRAL